MTSRDRWLAALRFDPVDRLPFWPKLDAAYAPAQESAFREMTVPDIHAFIGSDRHEWLPSCLREVRSRTSVETESNGGFRRLTYRTHSGIATAAHRFDAVSQSWHPMEFPIKTAPDLRIMADWFADARCEVDPERLEASREACSRIGSDGITAETIGESPLMYLVEWLAGIQNAHYLLADHPSEIDTLFEVMHRSILERARLLSEHSPADLLYMGENTSTTLISPEQYRRYCVPYIGTYAGIVREHGRTLVLHMCGHLKALLPDLSRLDVAGFEAFTSPPVGNATLLDGRSACPDKCLIGGTNATLWLRPAREITAQIERHLGELPHHRGIVVTSAGVMPPLSKPETIRDVCDWVKSYPLRQD